MSAVALARELVSVESHDARLCPLIPPTPWRLIPRPTDDPLPQGPAWPLAHVPVGLPAAEVDDRIART